uniref:Peptidase S1 domain-containing protein n=1 Tax=Sander lucioperca TaxID=283035 RepID=A0A8C9X9U1_SANLU
MSPTLYLFPTGSKAQDCGLAPLNTRIVGGVNATAGACPLHHNVRETHSTRICCLIELGDGKPYDKNKVTNVLSAWILYFGRVTQSGPNVHEVNRTVSKIIIHPDYNNVPFNNDIALMKLSSPVNFTDYIRPVCLASNFSQFHNSTPCWATGWGTLGKDGELPGNSTFDSLQEVQIPVIGKKQCSCDYLPVQGLNSTDKMICAGQENKGVCQVKITNCLSDFQTWIMDQVMGANVHFVTFRSSGTDQDNSFVCSPNATSTPSTVATEVTLIVILVTLFLQHIVAP